MKRIYTTALVLLLASSNALAQWDLSNEDSTLNFISTKKASIGEVHQFKQLTGSIKDTGAVSLTVKLASVETNIPVRNERMKTMLFEIASFPTASITGQINPADLKKLAVGESFKTSLELQTSLHGISQDIPADVQVTKLLNNQLLVNSVKPIIINVNSYKLAEGIEKLRKIAKLPSISAVVPVTFNLLFNQ